MTTGDLHGGDDIPSDVPLILKASCDERVKRIRFVPNVQQLCFREFHQRIGHALQFDSVEFAVTWEDDDGEHCEITNDDDLKEALLYFLPAAATTGASATPPQPISMRVNVRVETAISLSDFGGSSAWGSDESDDDQWSVGDDGSSERLSSRSNSSDASGRMRLSHASGSGTPSSSSRLKTSSLGKDWSRSRRKPNGRHNSAASSSQAAESLDLNSLRSLSLQSSTREARQTSSSSSSSDDSMDTRAPRVKRPVRGVRSVEEPNGFNVHYDVECNACRVKPIVGVRYHCASCVKGADFCGDCERTGNAVRRSTHHNESHVMLKLATPLMDLDMADMMSNTLHQTLRRLASHTVAATAAAATLSASTSSSSSSSGQRTTLESSFPSPPAATMSLTTTPTILSMPTTVASDVRCSFCAAPFTSGVRYLCANCPIIGEGTRDGYNLCATCEVHSLKVHDPAHFFLKLSLLASAPSSYNAGTTGRIPLGDRWDVQEMMSDGGGGALLPCLYSGLESFDALPPLSASRSMQRFTPVRTPDGVRIEQQPNHQQGHQSLRIGGGATDEEDNIAEDACTHARWLTPWSSRTVRGSRDMRLHSMREARSRTIIPLENLVHPSILCDSCFHVIHGSWYRCCHCTSSYDLCTTCMSRIAHDPTHAFAVFKQPVDLDLFKSCVDHQDVGERQGSSRPMLPFPLT